MPEYVSEDLFIYFVGHCASHMSLSYRTIKLYLCSIRNFYIESGKGDPFVMPGSTPMLKLEQVLRGIKKTQLPPTSQRLPITSDILQAMCEALHHSLFGTYLDALMQAAITMAFYGFLRCGEFTCLTGKFDPSCDLARSNVRLVTLSSGATKVEVFLKSSKTDPFRQGITINLFQVGGITCPVTAIKSFLNIRTCLNNRPDSPLFLLEHGKPLTRKIFLNMLTQLCAVLGLDSQRFSGHSFRIGAATTAARNNVPEHMIQLLGRWSSDCFKTYIRPDLHSIAAAHVSLSPSKEPTSR
jgi:integrase